MQQEKGQIPIIILVIAIIAIVLFLNFSKLDIKILPSSTTNIQEEIIIYSEEESPTVSESNYYPIPTLDTTSPFRSNSQPSGGLHSNTREVFIALNTNENATCRYSTVSGVSYEYMQGKFSEVGSIFHSKFITTLSEGEFYNYYVKCIDEKDNKNSDDLIISFWVDYPKDFTPPVLSNAYPSGDILSSSIFETMIGISTNEPAVCRYSWGQGMAYNLMGNTLLPDGTQKYHTAKIINLYPGNAYSYFVRCKDFSGNVNTGDVMIHFKVAPNK